MAAHATDLSDAPVKRTKKDRVKGKGKGKKRRRADSWLDRVRSGTTAAVFGAGLAIGAAVGAMLGRRR